MSRVSSRQLASVRAGLSERDWQVVHDVQRVRLLTARQVERLHFREGSPLTQARRSRRTLERLNREGVLHRFERQIGGVRAGSGGYIYGLSPLGQRLVEAGGPAGGRRQRAPWEPSRQFMQHVLAVSELYVGLREAECRGMLEILAFDAEPWSWRWDDAAEQPSIKPDAYVSVGVGRFEEVRFAEVDLATESLTVIKRKAKAYVDYWHSGAEQQAQGVFPSVLFLTEQPQRVEALVKALGSAPADAWQLFQVGLLERATALIAGIEWSPIDTRSEPERKEGG